MFALVVVPSKIEQEFFGSRTFRKFSLEVAVVTYDKSNSQFYAGYSFAIPRYLLLDLFTETSIFFFCDFVSCLLNVSGQWLVLYTAVNS